MDHNIRAIADETIFKALADKFLVRFVEGLVSSLTHSGHINFDYDNPKEEDVSLIYDLAFTSILPLEDHGGFSLGREKYVTYAAFMPAPDAPRLPDQPTSLIISTKRTNFHGGLSDDIIIAGINRAKPD